MVPANGPSSQEAADRSTSPLSQGQAYTIAKAEVAKRERWPENKVGSDHLTHTVAYGASRVNDGGWRVVARQAVTDGHAVGWYGGSADIIVIDKQGKVTDYFKNVAAD